MPAFVKGVEVALNHTLKAKDAASAEVVWTPAEPAL
jgi:hypothetical protein